MLAYLPESRALVYADRPRIELSDVENHALWPKACASEFDTGLNECRTESLAGEVGPKPKSVKDRVPAFLEVVETDEFSVFRADAEEPLWVLGRDAVIVVEVVGRRISPGRSLDKQFRCREFNSEVHARPSFAGEDRTALRNVPCQDVFAFEPSAEFDCRRDTHEDPDEHGDGDDR